jgi:hypothetical protein
LEPAAAFDVKTDSEAYIQTYLFKTDATNASHKYGVGESEIIDGLDEFHSLHPWNGQTPLVILVGDWDCRQCGQCLQWAKITLSVVESSKTIGSIELLGRIESIEALVPRKSDTLDGVHLVEPYLVTVLVTLSGGSFDGKGEGSYFDRLVPAWPARSVEQRCSLIVEGFRTWCAEVAGIDIDHKN